MEQFYSGRSRQISKEVNKEESIRKEGRKEVRKLSKNSLYSVE